MVAIPLLKSEIKAQEISLDSNDYEPTTNLLNNDNVVELLIHRDDNVPLEPTDLSILKVIACGRFYLLKTTEF